MVTPNLNPIPIPNPNSCTSTARPSHKPHQTTHCPCRVNLTVPFRSNPIQSNPFCQSKKDSLLVAPILQVLILNRNPVEVLDWADRVARWDFKRVVPAHLKNDIPADGKVR